MKIVTAIAIALFLWLQYQLWFAQGGLLDIWRLHQHIAYEKKLDEKWDQRNHVLKADIKDLHHGNEAIEERARDNLGMIKKGETYYRIVDTKQKQSS